MKRLNLSLLLLLLSTSFALAEGETIGRVKT